MSSEERRSIDNEGPAWNRHAARLRSVLAGRKQVRCDRRSDAVAGGRVPRDGTSPPTRGPSATWNIGPGAPTLEVFVARPEANRRAASLVQESIEVVENGDPESVGLLRELEPNWWYVSAHLDGEYADQANPDSLLCRMGDEGGETPLARVVQ
jgi:hypothetical protein